MKLYLKKFPVFRIFFLLTFLIFLSIGLTVFFFNTPKKKAPIPLTPRLHTTFTPSDMAAWKQYMRQAGSEKAYTEFKKSVQTVVPQKQHMMMHRIGGLFYEVYGIDGLPVCDNTFAFGCYHGYFGAAIQEKGMTNLQVMDEACIKKFGIYGTGCQHGMGHGMMVYLGEEKLEDALQACDTLKRKTPLGGCKTGVFMEYNLNTIRHDDNPQPRKLDPLHPYFPCDTLDEQYQHPCYYSQPEWWNRVYNNDAKKIGDLCEALTKKNKDVCYIGTGLAAALTTYFNTTKTLHYCDQLSYEYGRMLCKAGAAWAYKADKKQDSEVSVFCKQVPHYLQETCVKQSESIQ